MDDFLLGLLGVKCSKAAPQHHESLPRPIEAPLQDQDAHVQEERPVVARQRRQEEMWRSVGVVSASLLTIVLYRSLSLCSSALGSDAASR